VDRRYWWQFLDAEDTDEVLGEKDNYCLTSCLATWNELLAHIVERIGETYEPGEVPSAYGKPDCREFNRQ
jgi:hypothetical protein